MLLFAYLEKNLNKEAPQNDFDRVAKIRTGDEKAFEELFFEYYNQLSRFANTITKSREFARDTVQDVFLKIWRNRANWEVHISLKVYLYQSVRNQSLNLLEKQKTRQRLNEKIQFDHASFASHHYEIESYPSSISDKEIKLIKKIWEIVEEMPERRRLVFELHRKHGLSYKEIAKVLDIARKTVENHVAQALQFIRDNIDINEY